MRLEITAFGVGHGDAILLRWANPERDEHWNCLVDAGTSRRRIAQHLSDSGIRSLDLVIGTHPDSDHVGGLVGLSEELDRVDSYWGPPIPAFERHRWLFGKGVQSAIDRCRAVEESLKSKGTEVLYPVEGYSSAPFGASGPRIHVASPAARLVRHLLTSEDVTRLLASDVMPLGWILEDSEEPDAEQSPDLTTIDRALAVGALTPDDIPDWLRRPGEARPEGARLAKEWSDRTGVAPEFFGDSAMNNTSIVCWIEIPNKQRNYTVLLPGDQENWTYLLARHPLGLHADVFKAPHHGGRLFLEQQLAHEEVFSHVQPAVVIFSANGTHGLPRTAVRDAAIRWGATVVCTSERSQETIIGLQNSEDCCHRAGPCDRSVSRNVVLFLDENGIRSPRISCHSGRGSVTGPAIEIRQHIVSPSNILDHLTEHELRRHILWVRDKLREIHVARQGVAEEMEPGSETLDDSQVRSLALEQNNSILAAHLPVVLAKGCDRGAFWACSKDTYRDRQWRCYASPTHTEIRKYLARLREKIMILFPDAADMVHRDPDSLLTRLETCGLSGFADAVLHFPGPIFLDTFWPAVMKAFKSRRWHCFIRGRDVVISPHTGRKQILIGVATAFVREDRTWDGQVKYEFFLDPKSFPYSSPVLVSGTSSRRYNKQSYDASWCREAIQDRWLPRQREFHRAHLGPISRVAKENDIHLRCAISWKGRTYQYSSETWDKDKEDIEQWPAELASAMEDDSPIRFTIKGPDIAMLLGAEPKLLDQILDDHKEMERLW